MTIRFDTSNAASFLPADWLDSRLGALETARDKLEHASGAGGAFTGWVHLPRDYDKEEYARIQAAAQRIRSDSQALVVIGIGGSYLGARAVAPGAVVAQGVYPGADGVNSLTHPRLSDLGEATTLNDNTVQVRRT